MNPSETIRQAIINADVQPLCKFLFNQDITGGEVEIIKAIVFDPCRRIAITALTRYGKTWAVAQAVLMWALFNPGHEIDIISPQYSQSSKLMEYIGENISNSIVFRELVDVQTRDVDRLKKEVSKKHITFSNGSHIRILSGQGTGERLMGHGGQLIVCVPGNSLIKTDIGNLKISEIVKKRIPCNVLSYNHKSNTLEFKPILKYYDNGIKDLIRIKSNNGFLECTNNHPVYVIGKGYIPASNLKVGDTALGLRRKLNIFDGAYSNYASNNLRSMSKRVLQTAKPYKKDQEQYLQCKMQGNIICQTAFKESINKLRNLWKRGFKKAVQCKRFFTSLLFKTMCRSGGEREEKCIIQKKDYKELSNVWNHNGVNSCFQTPKILLSDLRRQSPLNTDDCFGEPCLERRNWKKTISLWIYKATKIKDKTKVQKHLCKLRTAIQNWLSLYSSYKLRQKGFEPRQFNSSLFQLPWKNKLQAEVLGKEVITKIERVKGKRVYNLEVKDNNNYFVNGFLTHNCDESCLLSYEVFRSKISRMEEESEGGVTKIVQIGNPWHKNNQFYQAWIDPSYKNVHIGWKQGVEEGRITERKLEEQRQLLSPIEFTVLYESEFPDSAEDALIKYEWILDAQRPRDFQGKGDVVWGLDCAEKGTDKTILIKALKYGNTYEMLSDDALQVDDTMQIVGEVQRRVPKADKIFVDSIGVGAGVYSRLKELDFNAVSVRVSKSPTVETDRFLNQKSQFYWRLRELFEHHKLSILRNSELITQLSEMRWELTSAGKIKIVDPDKGSPDHADALMLACCDYKEAGFVGVVAVSRGGGNKKRGPFGLRLR